MTAKLEKDIIQIMEWRDKICLGPPTQKAIAEKLNKSEGVIYEAMQSLKEKGLVERQYKTRKSLMMLAA